MKKILLFTLGLLAASTTAWADVVDFLSTSPTKLTRFKLVEAPTLLEQHTIIIVERGLC